MSLRTAAAISVFWGIHVLCLPVLMVSSSAPHGVQVQGAPYISARPRIECG